MRLFCGALFRVDDMTDPELSWQALKNGELT